MAAEEWMDINLEENSTINQNKVKKKPKPKRSNQKATIITTGGSSVINGERRKIGVGSSMRKKEKGKARVGAKVGTKVMVLSHIPVDTRKLTLPKGSNQNTSNPKSLFSHPLNSAGQCTMPTLDPTTLFYWDISNGKKCKFEGVGQWTHTLPGHANAMVESCPSSVSMSLLTD